MRGIRLLSLTSALVALSAGVAADVPEVILVDDGATKVEKAVLLENVVAKLIVDDVNRVEALTIKYVEAVPVLTDLGAISPEKGYSVIPESTAYRRCGPTLADINQVTGYKPPADAVPRTNKLFLKHCAIRQC